MQSVGHTCGACHFSEGLNSFMSIYCAREFSAHDIQTIGDLIAQDPKLQRSALSRKLCQLWGWTKPNGDLKDMTCRVALLRMQADELVELPPSRIGVVRKRAHFAPTAASNAQTPIKQPVHALGRITLRVVSGYRLKAVERICRALPLLGLHGHGGQSDPLQRLCR